MSKLRESYEAGVTKVSVPHIADVDRTFTLKPMPMTNPDYMQIEKPRAALEGKASACRGRGVKSSFDSVSPWYYI